MQTPPSTVAGWIGPVLLYLTVVEAMRLERTSSAWRRCLESADEVWRNLAITCGVSIAISGPLTAYVAVKSWRRVCCELAGPIVRDLWDLDKPLGSPTAEGFAPGTVVELADGSYGQIIRPLRSYGRDGGLLEEYTVRTPEGTRTVGASAARSAPPPRSPRWWRAVAALEVEDQSARHFCEGLAFRFWRAESGGVYTFAAPRATPVHYRRSEGWCWSPDRVNWMRCADDSADGYRWRAHSLAGPQLQIARFLDRHDPVPPDFCLEATTADLALNNPHALSRARVDDDARAALSARRALAPDARGAVLALANTHVHVAHAPFEHPTNLLHLEPWTIRGHPGGWIHSTNGGSTWDLGHRGLLEAHNHNRPNGDDDRDQQQPMLIDHGDDGAHF